MTNTSPGTGCPVQRLCSPCVPVDTDAVSASSDEKSENSSLVLTEHLCCSCRCYRLTVTGPLIL